MLLPTDEVVPKDQLQPNDQSDVGKKQNKVDRGLLIYPLTGTGFMKLIEKAEREAKAEVQEFKQAVNPSEAAPTAALDTSYVHQLVLVDSGPSKPSDPKLRPVCEIGVDTGGPYDKTPTKKFTTVEETSNFDIPNKDQQFRISHLTSIESPTDDVVKFVDTASLSTGLSWRGKSNMRRKLRKNLRRFRAARPELCSMGSLEKEMTLDGFPDIFVIFWYQEIRPLIMYLDARMSRDDMIHYMYRSQPGRYMRLVSDCFVKLALRVSDCERILKNKGSNLLKK